MKHNIANIGRTCYSAVELLKFMLKLNGKA